ncbi:hypothetical protein ACFXTI_041501 [Malus domestica]
MASRKAQSVPATGAKNKSVLVATGVTLGITTRSMARATSAASFTSASTLPREQKHPRHEPLITLASLRAPRGEAQGNTPNPCSSMPIQAAVQPCKS